MKPIRFTSHVEGEMVKRSICQTDVEAAVRQPVVTVYKTSKLRKCLPGGG